MYSLNLFNSKMTLAELVVDYLLVPSGHMCKCPLNNTLKHCISSIIYVQLTSNNFSMGINIVVKNLYCFQIWMYKISASPEPTVNNHKNSFFVSVVKKVVPMPGAS